MKRPVPYFANKTCDVCKKPAKLFRCIGDKHYILCDNPKCSQIIKIRESWQRPLGDIDG
jgi:hypothetical protein